MGKSFGLDYNRGGEMVELIIRDGSGAKIDVFKTPLKDFSRVIDIIKRKYGITFKPEIDRDLSWLEK